MPAGNQHSATYRKIYNNPAIWSNYGENELGKDRVCFILSKIPADVHSIIDVGCGSGAVLNRIEGKETVGVDGSWAALEHVKSPRLIGDVTRLPFLDDSFDLSMSCEVLEHLSKAERNRAVKELFRISRRYILITVPYKENLSLHTLRCPACGFIFHRNGHLDSFDEGAIRNLVGKWDCVERTAFGPSYKRYSEGFLRALQRLGVCYGDPKAPSICPNCQNASMPTPGSFERRCRAYSRKVSKFFFKAEPNWLFVLLRK